jgi:hypothetical protein
VFVYAFLCTGEARSDKSKIKNAQNSLGNREHVQAPAGMAPLPSFGRGNGGKMFFCIVLKYANV